MDSEKAGGWGNCAECLFLFPHILWITLQSRTQDALVDTFMLNFSFIAALEIALWYGKIKTLVSLWLCTMHLSMKFYMKLWKSARAFSWTDGNRWMKCIRKHRNAILPVKRKLKTGKYNVRERGEGNDWVTQREVDFMSNINHGDWMIEVALKKGDRERERQNDRELFDEFMWVRSWVAWSKGLNTVEMAKSSISTDTLTL